MRRVIFLAIFALAVGIKGHKGMRLTARRKVSILQAVARLLQRGLNLYCATYGVTSRSSHLYVETNNQRE